MFSMGRFSTEGVRWSADFPRRFPKQKMAGPPRAAASRNLAPSLYVTLMSGEPSNFNARVMARWLAIRGRAHAKRQPPGPRPTLGDLQRSHCWTWIYCEKCFHHAPMAFAPLIFDCAPKHPATDCGNARAALIAATRERRCSIPDGRART
jgi:hypothetical protein